MRLCQLNQHVQFINQRIFPDLKIWICNFGDYFWLSSERLQVGTWKHNQNPGADKPSVLNERELNLILYSLKKEEGSLGRPIKFVWWSEWQTLKVREWIVYTVSSFFLDHLLNFHEHQSQCQNHLWEEKKKFLQRAQICLCLINIGRCLLDVQ